MKNTCIRIKISVLVNLLQMQLRQLRSYL